MGKRDGVFAVLWAVFTVLSLVYHRPWYYSAALGLCSLAYAARAKWPGK
jgi:hypothetical protein